MAYSKVILNGTTIMDATTATAAAADITSPKTAMLADGMSKLPTGVPFLDTRTILLPRLRVHSMRITTPMVRPYRPHKEARK